VKILYGKKRSFQSCWFGQFRWLQYDIEKDEATCFPCIKFGKQNEKLFKFIKWNSLARLHKHDKCKTHLKNMVLWVSSKAQNVKGRFQGQADDE
jgi:hypothetical protein